MASIYAPDLARSSTRASIYATMNPSPIGRFLARKLGSRGALGAQAFDCTNSIVHMKILVLPASPTSQLKIPRFGESGLLDHNARPILRRSR